MSFNWIVYKKLHEDLEYITGEEYYQHFLSYGKSEGKKYTIFDLYPDFNHQVYRNNYPQLAKYEDFELEKHWLETGSIHGLSYRNLLSDINETCLTIVEYDQFEVDDLNAKEVLIILTNDYELNEMEQRYYRSILDGTLENIATIVTSEESEQYMNYKNVQYVVYLALGDIITQRYIIQNIQHMKENDICVMKPNSFYYMGEHQVYHVSIDDYMMYLKSGTICKNKVNQDEIEFINNIQHELFVKYVKQESEILNDPKYKTNVSDHIMAKRICREIDSNRMINIIRGIPPKKAYITILDKSCLETDYMLRLQLHLTRLLVHDFEIIDYVNISSHQLTLYETILIDGNLFNKKSTKISVETMIDLLAPLSLCQRNIMLTHDLHDWSFGFAEKPEKYEYIHNVVYPCLSMTEQKKQLKKLCLKLNIRSMISIYDCPEYTFLKDNFRDTIPCFYTLHHFISTPIYHIPKIMNKDIDILFYGVNDSTYYLFRNRLLHIAQKRGDVTNIIRKFEFDSNICEDGLARYISRSWMTISCVSNFSYAVRKYNEISESGSVVIGNTNHQIDHILKDGMIRIHEDMSDEEIITIMDKYLRMKIKLVYLGFKARKNVAAFNDNHYLFGLNNIIENGIDVIYPEQPISYQKLKKIMNKRVTNGYFSFDPENSEIVIEISNKTFAKEIEFGCILNTNYYRSVVINGIYYIYIEQRDTPIDVKLIGLDNIHTVKIHYFQ
jgi:hypothetical protein